MKQLVIFLIIGTGCSVVQAQPADSAKALLEKADAAADLYNWRAAAIPYQRAERAFRLQNDTRNALYAHIGYVRATMDSANLPQLSNYFGAEGTAATAKNDLQLAMKCYIAKGDVDAEIESSLARADWEQVFRFAKQFNNQRWISRATGEIGFHLFVEGDHERSKKNTALALLAARHSGDFADEIRLESGIGTGLELAGATDQANEFLDRALALAHEHTDTGYPYMAVAGKIMTLIRENNLEKATTLIDDDLTHSTNDRRYIKLTQARLFLADVAIAKKNNALAIRILEQTILSAKRNGTRLLTEVYAKLADLYRTNGSLQEASNAYAAAIASSGQNHDMYLAPKLMLTLARIKCQLHRDKEAEALFDRATDVVEGMLAHTTEFRIREALLTTMSEVYAEHFALAAIRGHLQEAYQIIERVRGRIVAELLFTKPHSDDVDTQNEAVEQKIATLKLHLVSEQSPNARQNAIDALFYADLQRWTVGQTPLSTIKQPKVSISDVRGVLRPNEALLEYVLNADESYCLILSKSEMRLAKLPPREGIETAAAYLLSAIHNHQDASAAEQRLFTALVAPLGDLSKYRYLTIVPDGRLHTIPFDVLRNAGRDYLGLQYAISYTPSAGTEYMLRTRHSSAEPLFLGVGGVMYTSTSASYNQQRASRAINDTEYDLSTIHDLPGSEEEIRTAAALLHFHAELIIGESATKTEVEKADLSRYRVVHYAVHGVANAKHPDDAALILRSDPPRNDGFLEVRDILRTRLNAELVVLSACETAVGRLQGEEGISSLAQAFLIAGASSVVPTLWNVDDVYSLFLMKRFYARLAQDQDKALALQGAKADLLQKFGANTAPAFWAGFTLIGDTAGRIQPNQNTALLRTNQ